MLEEIFARQVEYSVQDKFDSESNHKRFFFEHDGLHNLEHEIVFSILGRYHCGAGCQVCFLNGHWLSQDQIPVAKTLDEAYEERALDVFGYFDSIATVDDLRYLKTTHPHLFDFYRRWSSQMEFHTTDNGLFTHYDILMNDVHFKNIGQISFSDHLLAKKDGRIVDEIIEKLCKLNDRSPISRINFVITKPNPENDPNVMRLVEWASKIDHTLSIYFHNDIRYDVDFFTHFRKEGYVSPSAYYIETSTSPVTKCGIYSETVHLRYQDFYPDLYGSMNPDIRPYYSMNNGFDPGSLVTKLLAEKLRMYKTYYTIMSDHNKLWDYFHYTSKCIEINQDFTFIPSVMLNPKSKFYQRLVSNGYTNTHAGLLRKGASVVRPVAVVV